MAIHHEQQPAVHHGKTVEYRVHFPEFIRVTLGNQWIRISDYFPWRVHFIFTNQNGNWMHGNHAHATDNGGW